jgi:hypothetical protein
LLYWLIVECLLSHGKEGLIKVKKYILSPLCSAVVVPGFGQVLNGKAKKGLILMSLTFILFIAATVKLVLLITAQLKNADIDAVNNLVENKLINQDLSSLWILVALFVILWLYSVIDALIDGIRIEKVKKGNSE